MLVIRQQKISKRLLKQEPGMNVFKYTQVQFLDIKHMHFYV